MARCPRISFVAHLIIRLDESIVADSRWTGQYGVLRTEAAEAVWLRWSQIAFAREATALAVVSVGALAVGALAIGRLAIKRVAIVSGRIDRLSIDELEVNRLRVHEVVTLPPMS